MKAVTARFGRRELTTAALLTPLVAVFAVGFVLPLGDVLRFSFDRFTSEGQVSAWSVGQYHNLLTTALYRALLVRTFGLALAVVVFCALLGYPMALAIVRGPRTLRGPLLVTAVLPLLVSVVVKTFGWSVLLGANGPVQQWVDALGLHVQLLFSKTGVVIGMVQTYLPFMVLTLVSSLKRVDPCLEEAAASLGAPPARVFRTVVLPQSARGLATGSVLVFVLSLSAFVIPEVLGGGKVTTLVGVIYQQATSSQDWPLASAAGVLLLCVTLLVLVIHAQVMRRVIRD